MKIRAFITHKKAEHFQDCQDRFSVNRDTKSVAVSDGMSQSIFQKIWAEILVDAYTKSREWTPSNESDHSTVKTILSSIWKNRVKERLNEMQKEGRNTTRTENSLALGGSAGATIVGVRFEGNKWNGDVLGDSCLIEVKDSKIVRFLSSQDGDGFDNHPDYYDSNPNRNGKGVPKAIDGELSSGMSLLLVSDPFSDFFMEQKKNDSESQFVEEILSVKSHEDFETLVSKWRAAYGMHNDDSTLLIIEPDGSDDLNFLPEDLDKIEDLIERDTVAAPKATANPFHRSTPKPAEKSKSASENSNVSKLSNEFNERIEIATPAELTLVSAEPEVTSAVLSGEVEPLAEPMVPTGHFHLQNTENDDILLLQRDLKDARQSCEQAQADARDWENKYKTLFAEKLNIESERASCQAEKNALENAKAQLEEDLKIKSAEKNKLDRLNAELNTKFMDLSSLNQDLEKEKKQLKDQVEILQKKMQDSDAAHETEISHKDQIIEELEKKLCIAQSHRTVQNSDVLSFCLEQYDLFRKTLPIYKRLCIFDQRDEMSKIITCLLDSYRIIER